ncbi:MAG: phospholipase D family nuclease [Roseateles sp.]|uniref:phospholipase D family nuclease n=1 Tax=Roseateles sp. TaxID=1971397 RepID=UPI0040350551
MTRKNLTSIGLALAVAFASAHAPAAQRVPLTGATVDVYFAPQDEIGPPVADLIRSAKRRVWVAGYYFTHAEVGKALREAKGRGIDVRVVLDSSQFRDAQYSGATYLLNAGVPVWMNDRHAVMHHKFIVVDDDRTAFGSANFTKAAMGGRKVDPAKSNAENFNIFFGVPALTKQYADEFGRLAAESVLQRDRS